MAEDDETLMTEISIGPDGRVYVFGLSKAVLEILSELTGPASPIREKVEQLRGQIPSTTT